uniref:Uncharacterized protein n=1 Tax=Anopheles stephensi TaxID=30069 RepID=A0A182YN48_ANOST
MSLLTDSCSPFEVVPNACKICEESYEAMGSIICPEADTKMLEKIYKSTNVRVQPRNGIITPVCDCCRSRIDEYDEHFKPYVKEYYLDTGESDGVLGDKLNEMIDPLADAAENPAHSSDDAQPEENGRETDAPLDDNDSDDSDKEAPRE